MKKIPVRTNSIEEIDKDTFYLSDFYDSLISMDNLLSLARCSEGFSNDENTLKTRIIALDIETGKKGELPLRLFDTGYDRPLAKSGHRGPYVAGDFIRIISITHIFSGITYVFDILKILDDLPEKSRKLFLKKLQTLLDYCLVIGHNIIFDMHYLLYHYDIRIKIPYCTYILMEAIVSFVGDWRLFPNYSLAGLVKALLKKDLSKTMQLSNWNMKDLTIEQKKYASMDTRIYIELIPELQKLLLNYCFKEVNESINPYAAQLIAVAKLGDKNIFREMQVLLPLADMAAYGTPVDIKKLKNLLSKYNSDREKLLTGLGNSGLSSATRPGVLYKWLAGFDIPGLESLFGNRKNKRPSLNEFSLRRLMKQIQENPCKNSKEAIKGISDILNVRHLTKSIEKLLEIESFVVNDRIHAVLNAFGAGSGRMSSSSPNLQNVGTDESMRKIFAVNDETHLMTGGDYPQIELRIASVVANDEVMKNAFRKGQDLHSITAAAVANIQIEDVNSEKRSMAKAINFGFLYGMGAKGFKNYAEQQFGVTISQKEAEEARKSFFNKYQGVKEWHLKAKEYVEKALLINKRFAGSKKIYRTTTKTLSGRPIGIIPEYHIGRASGDTIQENFSLRQYFLNYVVQGTGADILKDSLINFYYSAMKEKVDAHVVNVVHDEIIVECTMDNISTVAAILKKSMQDVAQNLLGIPVPVDVGIGKDWKTAKG